MQSRKNTVFAIRITDKGLIILMDKELYKSVWDKKDQQTNKKVDKGYKQISEKKTEMFLEPMKIYLTSN